MKKTSRTLLTPVLGLLWLLPMAGTVSGQATDIKCTGCVGTQDLQNKGVKRRDIAKDTVNSSRVADNSLKGKDIRDEIVTGADVKDGSLGILDLKDELIADLTVGDLVVVDINGTILGPYAHSGGAYFRIDAGA